MSSEIQDEAYTEAMEEIARLKALITELADALDRSDPIQISIQEMAALVQRAREATGCDHVWEAYSANPGYQPAYGRCIKCGIRK